MPALTRAQRDDCLTELRELVPATRDRIADAMSAASHTADNPTAYESPRMVAARDRVATAYRNLSEAHAAYLTAVQRGINELETP